MKLKYTVVLERNEDGSITAWVPALPGCVSQGESPEEALRNITEAIEGYLESLRDLGKALPVEAQVEVEV